ncbi:MAG: hypothetical protein ACUVXI_05495 [bacterium]
MAGGRWPSQWFPGYAIYPRICHFPGDASHLLLHTTDDNTYSIYSSVYMASEKYGFKSSLGIVVKPYVEGGAYPEMAPPYPSAVELREAFLSGHSVVMHGYDHSPEVWQEDAWRNERVRDEILEQCCRARRGIFDLITQHPIITMWPPWSCDHLGKGHGPLLRRSHFVYCAQRQPGGEYHHLELDLPTRDLEVFQNSRDRWDMYPQLVADMDRGGRYTHVWGHGTLYNDKGYDDLADDFEALCGDVGKLRRVWSAGSEMAARYIIERKFTAIEDWREEGEGYSYTLRFSPPPDLATALLGREVYNMPLSIAHDGVGEEYFAYEEAPSGLRRLNSHSEGGTLYYDVVPRGQVVRISRRKIDSDAPPPSVELHIKGVDVSNPVDGSPTRGGRALEVIVEGRETDSSISKWCLTVLDGDGRPYVDHFRREVEEYELPANDWLDGRRGKILYFVERGYDLDAPFDFSAKVTDARGKSSEIEAKEVRWDMLPLSLPGSKR